jgi:DNA-binding NarL/FixJ family response regulator
VLKAYDNGRELIEEASLLHPDLFLLDISMAGLSGIETARQLRVIDHDAKIVFLTVHNDRDYLRSALATGALGYIVKRRLALDLVPALREALAGRRFVSNTPALAGAME